MDKISGRAALTLETERLYLRPFLVSDAEVLYELNEDPEVLQYTGDSQFEDIATLRAFLGGYSQYDKYRVGRLTTILKDTGEVLGWCGLKYHPQSDYYDIGYRFFKRHWGKGYASESAARVIADGFDRIQMREIAGNARIENKASVKVLQKLGFTLQNNYLEDGENWSLYTLKNYLK